METLWVQGHGSLFKVFSEVLGLTTSRFWWYGPFIYGGLCPICYLRSWAWWLCIRVLNVFMSLAIINALGLKASLRDIHHSAFLRFILEEDSISLTSKACICFCLCKGSRLWLIVRPSICSFHITHFTFILALD